MLININNYYYYYNQYMMTPFGKKSDGKGIHSSSSRKSLQGVTSHHIKFSFIFYFQKLHEICTLTVEKSQNIKKERKKVKRNIASKK